MIGERVYRQFEDRFLEINRKQAELFRDVAHVVLLEYGWKYKGGNEFSNYLAYTKDGVELNVWPYALEIEVLVKNGFDLFDPHDVSYLPLGVRVEELFEDYLMVVVRFDDALPERIDAFLQFLEARINRVMEDV